LRILGLDVGSKRIGLALSDELLLTAQGLQSLERKDLETDLKAIAGLVASNDVVEVVVGLPLSMDGTESKQTKEVREFIVDLTEAVSVPVKAWDERLTSVQAERAMLEADLSRAKRRKLSDKVAAQLILQSYLDARKR